LILTAVLYFTIVARVQHFLKIYEDYGLLTVLIFKSILNVGPFLSIFMMWNCYFAMELYLLKSNESDAEAYKGIPYAFRYFFIAFENGLGNTASASIEKWEKAAKSKFSACLIIYLIYIVWLFNQVLCVVLLNFVISLIS